MTDMTRQQAIAALTGPGAPYELETITAHGRTFRLFKTAPPSLRALFADAATDRPFIAYEDERLTFAEAWRQASRIGHLLVHRFGVRAGDRVAISNRR